MAKKVVPKLSQSFYKYQTFIVNKISSRLSGQMDRLRICGVRELDSNEGLFNHFCITTLISATETVQFIIISLLFTLKSEISKYRSTFQMLSIKLI